MANSSNAKYSNLALKVETVLNQRYVIRSVIGIGGFGITYQVYDIYNKQVYALKELFINDTVIRGDDGKTVIPYENKRKIFEHGVERFLEESSILHELNGVSNVVGITDYFQENNTAYFVMEYIQGKTLKGVMAQYGGRIPIPKAVDIIFKVGDTLKIINQKYHIFHRDLSPENILIRENGEPVIIDFGNAKNYMRNEGNSMSIVLKPGFAPPEQYTGKDQGPWTDVYSLAGILYYIISGTKVSPSTERIMGATYEPLCEKVPECPTSISNAIDRALVLNPKERIQDTGSFVESFASIKQEKKKQKTEGFPSVTVIENGKKKDVWRLPVGVDLIVGREGGSSNIAVSTSNQISKQHMIVSYSKNDALFHIMDISTNGIYLNGVRLKKGQQYTVESGQSLVLGNKICTLQLGI